ncbi:amino acid permease [Glutamicibacter sp. X7]
MIGTPTQSSQESNGLRRVLTSRQLTMIALGGAIGTGLFMGSQLGIAMAGSSVILSYLIGGLIALLVMGALAEMTVYRAAAGSFGQYAQDYLGDFGGYLIRYIYWSALVLAVGTEVSAVGDYMQLWFPEVPAIFWVVLFSAALLAVNLANVRAFGTTEYWFSAIKVFAVVAFIILAAWLVFGSGNPSYGFANYTAESGFFAHGFGGMFAAVIVAIFSYMGVEVIAIAAAESKNPSLAVRKAFKVTFLRLLVFYVLTMGLILALAPASELLGAGSPFVTVMSKVGIPFADSVLNVVLIVAALSAMNAQLYAATRTLRSLATAGLAPSFAARLASNGAPVPAVALSAAGIAVAALVYVATPSGGLGVMISLATFGAMATWLLILLTHVAFRRKLSAAGRTLEFRLPGYPLASLLGALLLGALLVTSIFTEQFRLTLIFGLPFTALISLLYLATGQRRRRAGRPGGPERLD